MFRIQFLTDISSFFVHFINFLKIAQFHERLMHFTPINVLTIEPEPAVQPFQSSKTKFQSFSSSISLWFPPIFILPSIYFSRQRVLPFTTSILPVCSIAYTVHFQVHAVDSMRD